jgi:hypothetical protein
VSLLRFSGALTQESEALLLRQVCPAVARDFLHRGHGFNGIPAICDREAIQGSEQTANESWGQLGHPCPDARPLSGEVISPGHGYQSYIGAARAARGIHEHA